MNLTNDAPRNPCVTLGGFAYLPRVIDKARAKIVGKLGDYDYGNKNLLDQYFFEFTGIEPDSFLSKVAEGVGDQEVLEWVLENTTRKLHYQELEAWSRWIEKLFLRSLNTVFSSFPRKR